MNYKQHSLKKYLDVLAEKTPVPGGGSAAALTGALGAALLSMVAQYSLKKETPKQVRSKIRGIIHEANKARSKLLALVDLDAKCYLEVVKAKKSNSSAKKKSVLAKSRAVPLEVCRLCYRLVQSAPYLVKNGNKYLISDVEVAAELILASFNSALVLTKA